MGYILDNDVKFLTGVGERRALLLQKELGIRTLGDLLYYFPFRYIDRSRIWRIGEIADDSLTYIQLRARITGFQHVGSGPKKRFIAVVADGSGTAELVWFKGINWIEKRLEAGREYIIFGRPAFFNGALNLVHPEVESVLEQANRFHAEVQGVYSTTEQRATGHEGDLYADVQSVAAGRGTSARDAARGRDEPLRVGAVARRAVQHPFSDFAAGVAGGRIPAEVRRTVRHPTEYTP